jgi:probable HAF family extracellular repeat protein
MVPSRSTIWRWVLALAVVVGVPVPVRAGFRITDLGALPPSGTSGAMALSGSGLAAGVMSSGGATVAALASAGGTFGAVAVPLGAKSSQATGVNSSGSVAGTYTDANNVTHGFTSSGGTAVALAPLTVGTAHGTFTQAVGINNSGTVVGTGDLPSGLSRAFTSSGGTETIIDPLGSGSFTKGAAINNNGVVVGTSEIVSGGLQRAFYTGPDGKAIDLTTRNAAVGFSFNTAATGIDQNADIVGYGGVGGFNHAFFAAAPPGLATTGPALVDLGTLGGALSSQANGVNDGQLVVGTSGSRAFLWGGSEGMFDLNSLISTADEAHWSLTTATAINDANQITGTGYLDGVMHGFVLTPIEGQPIFSQPGIVPEPSSYLSLATGLAWLAVHARTRFRRGRSGGRAVA